MSVTNQEMESIFEKQNFWRSLSWFDWSWALFILLTGGFIAQQYAAAMDGYEIAILGGTCLLYTSDAADDASSV